MALANVLNALNFLRMIKHPVYAVRRFLGSCGGIAVNAGRIGEEAGIEIRQLANRYSPIKN